MKRLPIIFLAMLALVACLTVSAAPRGSVFLGERVVDFHAQRDVIDVGNYDGWFHSLYFEVEKNNVEVFNLVIVYGDGQRERIDTRLIFDAGTRSRIIDLQGGKRRIKRIEFEFKTVGSWLEGRARIKVLGIR
jgi:hypothetical protein